MALKASKITDIRLKAANCQFEIVYSCPKAFLAIGMSLSLPQYWAAAAENQPQDYSKL
jgi:hypothetical protein